MTSLNIIQNNMFVVISNKKINNKNSFCNISPIKKLMMFKLGEVVFVCVYNTTTYMYITLLHYSKGKVLSKYGAICNMSVQFRLKCLRYIELEIQTD